MNEQLTTLKEAEAPLDAAVVRAVILEKNLAKLDDGQRVAYVKKICELVGISWISKPFDIIKMPGVGEILYANKSCGSQLRKVYGIALAIVETWEAAGNIFVKIHARDKFGREDEDIGFAPIAGLKGEKHGNAFLKAVTKGKRRVTLSICGLGFLDETEVEDALAVSTAPYPVKEGGLFASLAEPGEAVVLGVAEGPPPAWAEPPETVAIEETEFTEVSVIPTKREVADGLAAVIEEATDEFNSGTDPAECDALVEAFVERLPEESRDLIPFWKEALNLSINTEMSPVEAIKAAADEFVYEESRDNQESEPEPRKRPKGLGVTLREDRRSEGTHLDLR